MKKIILIAVIIVLLASCNTSKKLSRDSRLVDKSISSTQESKQEVKKYFNSLIIDTSQFSEVETIVTEIIRTELRDSSGTTITENIKETKTNSKKQNNRLILANNDSVSSKSNIINYDVKKDIKANDKVKESKEGKVSTNWRVIITLIVIILILIYWKRVYRWIYRRGIKNP